MSNGPIIPTQQVELIPRLKIVSKSTLNEHVHVQETDPIKEKFVGFENQF